MRPLVLALNPSIDVEWRVEHVRWEEKNQIQSERRWAGGKGVNVARWLQHLGGKLGLLLPLGGETGSKLSSWLRREKLVAKLIFLREATRVNIIVSSAEGRQLRFNPAGPKISAVEWRSILTGMERELPRSTLCILSGSLPRGLAVTAYARLIRIAQRVGVKAILDCDGPAFAAGVKAGPFLVKPNEPELVQWWGKPLKTERAVERAAVELSDATRGWVLVSRGSKGALLINQREGCCLRASAPLLKVSNTVGAGDAMLAAVAREIDRDAGPEEWLRWGVATGTAATQCAAGHLAKASFIRDLVDQIQVSKSVLSRS